MGLFKRKSKEQIPEDEVSYSDEAWVNGRLMVQKHRVSYDSDGTAHTYNSPAEPPDIVQARKTLWRVKNVKLSHSKSQRKNIEGLVADGEKGGLGELVREPSTSGVCHYRAIYKGIDVGLMPSNMVPQVHQCYGLTELDEYPEHVPCKIVLRTYENGGGWSAANIL